MNLEMLATMRDGKGFIAALDQSGGSTPKALRLYGIEESAYSGEAEMFDLIRWGIFLPQMKLAGDDIRANAGTANQWKTRAYDNAGEKHLLFPIPSRDLTLNSALEQNPLWK